MAATRVVPISELGSVYPGYSPRRDERQRSGRYLLIGGRNIKDGRLATTDKDTYVDEVGKESFRRAIAQPGDIIVSTLFETRKVYIYKDSDPRGVVNNSCAIIRTSDNNDYIVSYLRTLEGKNQFLRDASAVRPVRSYLDCQSALCRESRSHFSRWQNFSVSVTTISSHRRARNWSPCTKSFRARMLRSQSCKANSAACWVRIRKARDSELSCLQ